MREVEDVCGESSEDIERMNQIWHAVTFLHLLPTVMRRTR
jgi:hypothetical protein